MKTLKVVGVTKDKDKYLFCLGGLYDLHATHGFPLFMAFSECKERGFTFSIPHLMFSALADGRIWVDYLEDVETALRDAGLGYTVPGIKKKLNEMSAILMSEFIKNNPDDGTLEWFTRFGQFGKDAIECNFHGIYADKMLDFELTHDVSKYSLEELDQILDTLLTDAVITFCNKILKMSA